MSYFLPRKAGLMRPCGRAALRSGSSRLFSTIPRRGFWKRSYRIHLGRWCRSRILLSRSARVRIPFGAQAPVAQWQSVGKIRNRLFPGRNFVQALLKKSAKSTIQAGGVGNRYFWSGECGLESRRDCKSRRLTPGHPKNSVAASSPANNLRLVRIEMQRS